ncbi:MAG: thermonuclease family protein [Dolichospermum lemmermannii FEM_B0920]
MGIVLILISSKNPLNSETYTVLNVEDNLSLSISNAKEQHQIKLCGVDVPNSQQSTAKTLVVKELESVDNIVLVTFIGDKAEVFLTDSSPEKMLSEELLVQGIAKLQQDNCPNQSSLETAETIAKQNKIGVWK